MSTLNELSEYFEKNLSAIDGLRPYLGVSSVVSVELNRGQVYDLMVLMPDSTFEDAFKLQFGECFVVNDKDYSPPVFTRFKSHAWLRRDFSRRLSIALWIFGRGVVVQDPGNVFGEILLEYRSLFEQQLKGIIRHKYVEFRSDRHNLRQAVYRNDSLAIDLLKSNVIKLALEITLLAAGRPYPYKKWLPSETGTTYGGSQLVDLCQNFTGEEDREKVISMSDDIVATIVRILSRDESFSASFLNEWWLHLA
ncbi:MAG: hypothetical protein HY978_02965 [Candidatus Liptonbacteria bacterium]|nr:hypothetical protein [Candidatus Liptonbacteria bacterium]